MSIVTSVLHPVRAVRDRWSRRPGSVAWAELHNIEVIRLGGGRRRYRDVRFASPDWQVEVDRREERARLDEQARDRAARLAGARPGEYIVVDSTSRDALAWFDANPLRQP